jgi:hypothetical protein
MTILARKHAVDLPLRAGSIALSPRTLARAAPERVAVDAEACVASDSSIVRPRVMPPE